MTIETFEATYRADLLYRGGLISVSFMVPSRHPYWLIKDRKILVTPLRSTRLALEKDPKGKPLIGILAGPELETMARNRNLHHGGVISEWKPCSMDFDLLSFTEPLEKSAKTQVPWDETLL